MIAEIRNTLHGTRTRVRVPESGRLSHRQAIRVLRELCGMMDWCSCSHYECTTEGYVLFRGEDWCRKSDKWVHDWRIIHESQVNEWGEPIVWV